MLPTMSYEVHALKTGVRRTRLFVVYLATADKHTMCAQGGVTGKK